MKSEEIKHEDTYHRLEFLETQVGDQISDIGKIFKRLEIIEKRLDVHIDRNREAQKVDELLQNTGED